MSWTLAVDKTTAQPNNLSKERIVRKLKKTRWHPAFCAAMELERLANKKGLTYALEQEEHSMAYTCVRRIRHQRGLIKEKL